jgi:ABC-type branched-subunit amino acid transport system substrate-binding protein
LKSTGEFLNQAIAAYVKDVQESGEVPFRIVFEKEDDGYVAEKTVSVAQQKIKTFRPHAMVGVVGTSNTKLLIEKNVLTDAGIPLIGSRSGAPLYSPNIIHLKASYAHEVNKLLELSSVQGLDTVGVVYQGDEFGQDGLSAAQAFAAKNPYIKIVAQAPYTRNTVEIGPALATMIAAKPKSIVIIANTNATAAFVTELRKTDKKSKVFTISTADPKLTYAKAKEASIGVVFSQIVPDPYEPRFSVATDYRKFVEKNKLDNNSTTFEGYLIARITIDAAKRIKGPFTSQGMLSELRSKPVNLGGMRFNLTDPQRAISFVDTSIIGTNGQIFY